jgi:hypothetical protein
MSSRTRGWARAFALAAALLFAAALGILSTAEPASPADGTAGPVAVSVNPTSGLVDGQAVSIHAQASPDSDLFEIRTHLCRAGAVVRNTAEFAFDGPNCSPTSMSTISDYETILAIRPGTGGTGDTTFRVGVGSGAPWTDVLGGTHTLACGPDAPCTLVVQLQVPNTTVFYAVPLCFGTCPGAPTSEPPAALPPAAAGAAGGPGAEQAAGASPAAGASTEAAAVPKAGAAGAAATGSAEDASSSSGQAAPAASSTSDAGSGGDLVAAVVGSPVARRAARVFAGGVAGVVGGCLIAGIIIRARRQMAEMGTA